MAQDVPHPANPSEASSSNVRLDSWKEIAAYLKRDVTTVRRWEKREGLPVHRLLHHRRDSIYAYTTELDNWLRGRRSHLPGKLGLIAMAALFVLAITASALYFAYFRSTPVDDSVVRLALSLPEALTLADGTTGGQVTISPDGRRLAFVAAAPDGTEGLWVRPLDSLDAEALPGTDGASYPFWSPDSQFVGFFAQRKLKKIEATGGPVQTLCDAVLPRGGTWNRAGVIVFSANAGEQLFRVSSAGGQATALALDQPNRESHWPDFLPDGRHFVYLARRQKPGIYLASLESRDTKLLATGYMAVDYAAPGYLLLLAGGPQSETAGTLVAQRFDTRELQLVGEPVPIAEQVAIRPLFSRGVFSTSENGTLIYGTSRQQMTQLIWRDREGKQLGTVAKPGRYERAALSADEKTVAAEIIDRHVQTPDIWLIETTRGITSRFTSDAGAERMPLWSPDGSRIVFSSPREGNPPNLFQKTSSGVGGEELLFRSDLIIQPTDWSRDGRFIVYARRDPRTQWDLWVVPATPVPANGERKPVLYLQTQFNEHAGHFSADGKWMAYSSDESGRWEVYVRAFPSGGARWQISRDGGVEPRWGRDGKELFYVSSDGTLMTVAVQLAEFQASAPRALFKTRFAAFGADRWRPEYAPAVGGQRFLVNTLVEQTAPLPVTILLNWPAAFSRR